MSSQRRWIVVLFVAMAVAMARPGLAQQSGDQEVEVKARALFAEGRYADALAIYVQLYSEKAHPTYLRNIGRCYQNMEQPDKAISSFREYLRQAKHLPDEQRQEVEGYIREMEDLKRKQEAAGAQNRPATAPVAGVPSAAAPLSSPPALSLSSPEKTGTAAEESPSRAELGGRRRVALGLAGLGVVGLGVGTWFGLEARSKWNDATSQCPTPSSTGCSPSARQSGQSADRAADVATVSLVAGGLLATGGVVLWYLSRERAQEHTTTAHVQITPLLEAGMVSGAISGTF